MKQTEDGFFSQSKYSKNIVTKFGLDNDLHKCTFAASHVKLSKVEQGFSIDQSLYRSMIGILLYLTSSHLDITFFVGLCCLYQVNLKVSHPTQVKCIIKYKNGTCDYVILYSFDTNSSLVGYSDAD